MNAPKLTAGRCLCRGCGEYFTGEQSFDEHRVGTYQPLTRRCLSIEEMQAAGFAKDGGGFWMTPYDVKRYPARLEEAPHVANRGEAIPTPRVAPLPTPRDANITPDACPKFHSCSATICPLDDWRRRNHLPGERVCLWLRERAKPGGKQRVREALPGRLADVVDEQAPAIAAKHDSIRCKIAEAALTGSMLAGVKRLHDLDDAA